jgi:hypothetical protein
MGHLTKEGVLLAFVVTSSVFYVFVLGVTTNTITNVSGVVPEGVGVFKDSSCASPCEYIDWGTLTPGSTEKYDVYVLNKDVVPIYLIMSTANWSSSQASYYLTLRWNYAGQRIDPGDVLQLTLALSVSPSIKDVSEFSFDILIAGSQNLPGDINGDGRITGVDVGKFFMIYSGFITDPVLVARGDINGDGEITGADVGKIDLIYSGVL